MEIKTEDYQVKYDPETTTIAFAGLLRLSGMDAYTPITNLLDEIAAQNLPHIMLDLSNLQFLNSSGINMLSKFVLKIRQHETTQMCVKGSKNIPWQGKSLRNLQRLMPRLQLEFN